MSGESRQELIAWINDLLQLSYTKVEQCGTGAAYCQIIDSIYGDVQMGRVKFNTNQEYEYINNYKVLQKAFADHSIDKVGGVGLGIIPVERLMKCKFQDNLEFLQHMKKYWDTYFPGGTYDAVARRKGGAAAPPASTRMQSTGVKKSLSNTAVDRAPKAAKAAPTSTRAPLAKTSVSPKPVRGAAPRAVQADGAKVEALTQQITELKLTVDGMEKERDFYFGKLREIEVLAQQLENSPLPVNDVLKKITTILYSTEEGFEVPDAEEADDGRENIVPNVNMGDEVETY